MLRTVNEPSSEISVKGVTSQKRAQPERDYMVRLGERIREIREIRQLTQKEAAQASGIATDMISRLENGRYLSPGLRTLFRIASGLDTSIAELLPEPKVANGLEDDRIRELLRRAHPEQLRLITALAEQVLQSRPEAWNDGIEGISAASSAQEEPESERR